MSLRVTLTELHIVTCWGVGVGGNETERVRSSVLRGVALVVALLAAAGLSSCSSPSLASASCTRTSDDSPVLTAIARRLREPAILRNAEVVAGTDETHYLSAELHPATASFGEKGEILTWVVSRESYRSVDRNARERSSWPAADGVTLATPGIRTSRGCVYPLRGRKVCEQQSVGVAVPTGGQCPNARTAATTATTAPPA